MPTSCVIVWKKLLIQNFEQIIWEINLGESCETGAIEFQLKGESMEMCVEVTVEMEQHSGQVGCAIIPENFIFKMSFTLKTTFTCSV